MDIINEIYTTDGRLNRLRYFKYYLILLLASTLISFVVGFIIGLLTGQAESTLLNVAIGFISLVTGVGSFMLGIRRLHDLDKVGWFMLIIFVPFVNIIFALYLWFAPGTVGYNRFGADPLES